jgi:lipoic acid synthetase
MHLPSYLKTKLGTGRNFTKVRYATRNIHTVCEEASCPNRGECYDRGTATFLILGDVCTRKCLYCSIKSGKPKLIDGSEPSRIAETVKNLGLKYIVITSVTRDDLPDGGAKHFVRCIGEIRRELPQSKIEVLIPDYNYENLRLIARAKPHVISHNIEITQSIFQTIRPQGEYKRSLDVLKNIKKINNRQKTKSGFMIGLGENLKDIRNTIRDVHDAHADILTIGQYLRPSLKNIEVKRFYSPEEFNEFREFGISIGLRNVVSGPLVRSSYHADRFK